MIDALLNTSILFLSTWNPSILSLGYGLFGFLMWGFHYRKSLLSGGLYRWLAIYSFLVIGAKVMILIIYWINPKLKVFNNTHIFYLFGIYLETSVSYKMFLNFYAEVLALIISGLGLMYRARLRKNPKNLIRKSIMGVFVLFNLILLTLSYYSIINTLYFEAIA